MLKLKQIGNLAGKTGVSLIADSPLWNQDVDKIVPEQLVAFIERHKALGRKDEAETAVEIALREVHQAVKAETIDIPAMLSYYRTDRVTLTASEFKRGLAYIEDARAPAILFALETGMDPVTVSELTHRKLAIFTKEHRLSVIALECLHQAERHPLCSYVFWQEDEEGIPKSVQGLEAAVFDAFGFMWSELVSGYENLIWNDDEIISNSACQPRDPSL
ncbi:hypothetical protein [Herbaspirillum huttiense]|uniref:Uncharacterized protein n=1 Tax=Herbaspirillum huttiense subsp. lycopersici TaxID=3074428 RepID=A0ABU2EGT1_9BURK|nr:hypothetical protein [Herbaspirillum huttiense]MDR9846982.1 hypothetical protein [Herbaspirillum huttiense SE1]